MVKENRNKRNASRDVFKSRKTLQKEIAATLFNLTTLYFLTRKFEQKSKIYTNKLKHVPKDKTLLNVATTHPPLSFPISSIPFSKAKQDAWIKFIWHMDVPFELAR